MKRRLYEFTASLECAIVVAAESEKAARDELMTYEKAWIDTGDLVGVKNISLFNIRDPETQDEDELEDLAHVVL
jgi:hypothetical protein